MSGAPRSHLYVPGDRADVLAKATSRRADALIIDLEDAVAPSAKAAARESVAAFLRQQPAAGTAGPELWVRVNPGPVAVADLRAVMAPALAGVCLAKTESRADVEAVAALLDELEQQHHLAPGTITVAPLLESAAAVLGVREIAAAPRVSRLQVGEADLSAELGVVLGADERELLWVRSQVVLASAAAGIEPPVGPVSTNFADLDALRESTLSLQRMGYRSRACIHPAQVAVVNEVFTPTAEQLERARELVERYDAAIDAGDGVFTDASGQMVDLAVVRAARRTVAAAHASPEQP
ncbi:MAG: CoA ester lyase [Candidatus Nanopelagicales bacterium]